ncbi:hypothetical protein [Oceanibaculum indicum]|uniref:Uncharacterized protein n=1 Tax=Oceanibaculum indicum P24 TaxID=1207063 RepID=K2K054_9PROT|nr:hypothetical protein [Oceanibaculum indicum]EKE70910.1 hypothetical protein P24_15244 [Oceanibaculum indicum P24]
MSIDALMMEAEDAAAQALLATGALTVCPHHKDVPIRHGDQAAERHAYAKATVIAKSAGKEFMREDIMAAIQEALDRAADGHCPECERLKNL